MGLMSGVINRGDKIRFDPQSVDRERERERELCAAMRFQFRSVCAIQYRLLRR